MTFRESLIKVARWINPYGTLSDDANVLTVLGFILAGVALVIGVVIFSSLNRSIEPTINGSCTGTGSSAICGVYGWNSTWTSLVSNSMSGYNLLGVMLICIAAAGIVGVLIYSFMRGRSE